MSTRIGPKLTVAATCRGCVHEHGEHYSIEDGNDCDSGVVVSCSHQDAPRAPGESLSRVGDTTWETPKWCPLYGPALAAHIATLRASR